VKAYLSTRWHNKADRFESVQSETLKLILQRTMRNRDLDQEACEHCNQYRKVRPNGKRLPFLINITDMR
jgi:hypothetical protein